MRTLTRALLATAIVALAPAGVVSAATVSLVWTGSAMGAGIGGSSITTQAGDTITLTVFAGDDSTHLAIMQVSLEWDFDFGNELDHVGDTDLVTCPPWWVCSANQHSLESTSTASGSLNGFGAGMLFGDVDVPVGTAIGTVTFTVTPSVATDGADVRVWAAASIFTDANNQRLPFNVATASVDWIHGQDGNPGEDGNPPGNGIPEPGAAVLFGVGLGVFRLRCQGAHLPR